MILTQYGKWFNKRESCWECYVLSKIHKLCLVLVAKFSHPLNLDLILSRYKRKLFRVLGRYIKNHLHRATSHYTRILVIIVKFTIMLNQNQVGELA